ncbi:hypothetical protein U1Q18_043140 [Sarracenia purpurea var. burkii]
MYGGSGKLGRGGGGGGRGGGGGGGKRNNLQSALHHPPPLHRPSSATPNSRLPVGGGGGPRSRNPASGPSTSAPSAAEETFSLVTGNPLDFAMIIRLAPDLVDEIKRVEDQGGTARIKFDSNANNSSGNVIDVGGKDFRFTWSREMGDLCDTYEERQSGEDGNGLLVESGCAWRKLNVQRILDESTKKHVKMRSEEAERKLKSRKGRYIEFSCPSSLSLHLSLWKQEVLKRDFSIFTCDGNKSIGSVDRLFLGDMLSYSIILAIILDHGNPSMKSQMKALAAVESVGGPKSAYKSGLTTTTLAKGRPSISPLPSPPEQSGAPASPFGTGNITKVTSLEDVMPTQVTNKENAAISEKEMPKRVTGAALQEKSGGKEKLGDKPMDLQSLLISLLMEKPEGMSLKVSASLCTFWHGSDVLCSLGSSPGDNHHQTPAPEHKHGDIPASTPNFAEKAVTVELQKQAQLNSDIAKELNSLEKVDIEHHASDLFGDKKVSDNSDGPAGSSTDSGSDSDSECDSSDSGSDSGSHSGSRSKSRSPMGSGSGSSSDSESDASSNSKQGSDEDVDIMTSDDDKESKLNLQTSEPGFSTSPIPWRTSDVGIGQNGCDPMLAGNGSDVVETEKDFADDDQETEMVIVANSISNKKGEKSVEDFRHCSPDHEEHRESQVYTTNLFNDRENIAKDDLKHKKTDSSERMFKGRSRRSSDSEHLREKSEHAKRLKAGSLPQPQISRGMESLFSECPKRLPLDRVIEDPYKGHSTQMMNRASGDGNAEPGTGLWKGYNQGTPGKFILDYQGSGRMPVDLNAQVKAPDSAERPSVHSEGFGRGLKYFERNHHLLEGLPIQKDKVSREIQDEDCYTKEKKMLTNSKEGAFGDKNTPHLDSYNYGKHGELGGKLKESGEVSNSLMGYSPKDNHKIDAQRSPVVNGRGKVLQRELSDLELGELREPLHEETPGFKKEFERKGLSKQSENKPSTSDYWNLDPSKGNPTGRANVESGKPSPLHLRGGVPTNPGGFSKRRTPEHHAEDLAKPHHKNVQSQAHGQPHPSRVDRPEVGNQKSADVSGKVRHNEARANQGICLEWDGDTNKKASVNAPQHEIKQGPISHPAKESRTQKSNTLADIGDIRKDTSLTESNEGGLKRRESSSDENSSYSKYEKEEPELRGPIKDFSQYKEYVQEYREKYDSYCSLNKTLESYRYYEDFTCSCSRFRAFHFLLQFI